MTSANGGWNISLPAGKCQSAARRGARAKGRERPPTGRDTCAAAGGGYSARPGRAGGGWFAVRAVAWTLVGVALAAGVQWTSAGPAWLSARLPAWLPGLLPLVAFLLFGVFLAAVYGAAPGTGVGVLGALAALALAALPLAYRYGLAQRFGLPGDAGLPGALLTGAAARAAGALWFPAAVAAALRRAGRPRPARALPAEPPAAATAPLPFWSPPAPAGSETPPVAYTPGEGGRP